MEIRRLPPLLVSQIAAGEVIERPASVVKELVENSLDAGATQIQIIVEDGGRQLIRVTDDGQGIPPDQLPLAVAPHATSKLATPQQLATIATLGFRGEALASIASVSRLMLTSRATVDERIADAGAVIEVAGDQVWAPRPTGCAPGTTVEVRDLFFNTPARRKFMRTAATEFGHIVDTITRTAMVHPDVAFRLSHGKRTLIEVPGDQLRRRRCVRLLGHELEEALLEFEAHEQPADATTVNQRGAALWGLAGIPAIARSTSKFQFLCVNGRPVRDRNIAHAVKEAYRGLIPTDKQPLAVVLIDTQPDSIDVNVHPAKSEIRFRDPARVHRFVLSAIRQRLLATDLTPTASIAYTPPRDGDTVRWNPTQCVGGADRPRPHVVVPSNLGLTGPQKGFDFHALQRDLAAQSSASGHEADPSGSGDGTLACDPNRPTATHHGATDPLQGKPTVLQVHDTYLVTQDDQGLVIIDQHALHERVMFEELHRRVLGSDQPNNLESQRLLVPVLVQASPKRQILLDQLKPLTRRIGIEADPIGPDTVAIHAFPSFLFDRHVDPAVFVDDLLDQAQEGTLGPLPTQDDASNEQADATALEVALQKILNMMACKAAVRAGDPMSDQEMADLLAKRNQVERASSCPHGRPTTIRLTLRDMEKQFKRT